MRHSTHELAAYENNGGGFWATGQNQDQIARVKLDGTPEYFAVRTDNRPSGPHGMAFDKEGRLWVSLEMAGLIVRIDDKGEIAEKVDVTLRSPGAKQPINPSPHAIAFGPDGKTIWFTGKRTGTIGKIDPDVNGARNFPNYGEVKFPSLAGGVIRRRFDRGLRFLAAVRDV